MLRSMSEGMSWTGKHIDGKNIPGSYSALVVCETGAPFAGGFYLLPQYHTALDIRQGGCTVATTTALQTDESLPIQGRHSWKVCHQLSPNFCRTSMSQGNNGRRIATTATTG